MKESLAQPSQRTNAECFNTILDTTGFVLGCLRYRLDREGISAADIVTPPELNEERLESWERDRVAVDAARKVSVPTEFADAYLEAFSGVRSTNCLRGSSTLTSAAAA